MQILGQRADGARLLAIGAGLGVIVHGQQKSRPLDLSRTGRLGPWQEADNSLAARRAVQFQLRGAHHAVHLDNPGGTNQYGGPYQEGGGGGSTSGGAHEAATKQISDYRPSRSGAAGRTEKYHAVIKQHLKDVAKANGFKVGAVHTQTGTSVRLTPVAGSEHEHDIASIHVDIRGPHSIETDVVTKAHNERDRAGMAGEAGVQGLVAAAFGRAWGITSGHGYSDKNAHTFHEAVTSAIKDGLKDARKSPAEQKAEVDALLAKSKK